jgi:hypothetical protein
MIGMSKITTNSFQEMQAIFYGCGPSIQRALRNLEFTNINIYPLIAHVLVLQVGNKMDADFKVLEGILKRYVAVNPQIAMIFVLH